MFKDKLGVRQFAPSDEHIADLNTRLDSREGSKKGLLFLFCSFLVILIVVLNGTLILFSNFNKQLNSALKIVIQFKK